MTLNQIAYSIAEAVGESFDVALLERIKFSVKYYRAELLRQEFERSGIDRQVVQRMVQQLTSVDIADTCVVDVGCDVLRTLNKVPQPVAIKGEVFRYVGSPNFINEEWVHTDINELRYTAHNTFTADVTRYTYVNGYIYVYTNKKFKYVMLESVFLNPEEAVTACSDSYNCIDDDDEFPIQGHLIRRIVNGLVTQELRILTPSKEVQADDSE